MDLVGCSTKDMLHQERLHVRSGQRHELIGTGTTTLDRKDVRRGRYCRVAKVTIPRQGKGSGNLIAIASSARIVHGERGAIECALIGIGIARTFIRDLELHIRPNEIDTPIGAQSGDVATARGKGDGPGISAGPSLLR